MGSCVERDWAWVAHGRTNSMLHTDLGVAEERGALAEIVATIEQATGKRPKGWMGPGLTETFDTPRLLAELGLSYVLDWTKDHFDQLYGDAATSGRVMPIALHPFVIGQAFRAGYLDQALSSPRRLLGANEEVSLSSQT